MFIYVYPRQHILQMPIVYFNGRKNTIYPFFEVIVASGADAIARYSLRNMAFWGRRSRRKENL
jgi:hypothetical protein